MGGWRSLFLRALGFHVPIASVAEQQPISPFEFEGVMESPACNPKARFLIWTKHHMEPTSCLDSTHDVPAGSLSASPLVRPSLFEGSMDACGAACARAACNAQCQRNSPHGPFIGAPSRHVHNVSRPCETTHARRAAPISPAHPHPRQTGPPSQTSVG
jgi:hypothetical protein